jgi:hypothetical protein
MLIHRVTRCLPQRTRYGGRNRTDQIAGLLRLEGATISEVDFFTRDFSERAGNLGAGLTAWRNLRPPFKRDYPSLWLLGRFIRLLRAAAPGGGVLAWENTDDPLLGVAARHLGWRVLAFPHNLNALYNAASRPPDARLRDLSVEVAALATADAVYTIAPDENNFLRLFGVRAELLPYHPADDFYAELGALRKARSPRPDGPVLILGSANNAHTREGMSAQLRALASAPETLRRRVIVGGDATERLAAEFPLPGVEFAGRIPAQRLEALMRELRTLWIVQSAGTGVVTRLLDFTLAGIPVFANSIAARAWERTPGVHILDEPTKFPTLLETLPWIVPAPSPPCLPALLGRLG